MGSDDLNWRVEAACLNAWPSPRQILVDGWLFRSAGGPTRRVNSANPLYAGASMSDALIDAAEAFYAAQGQPTVFRVPDMAGAIDGLLDARGYALDAPVRTLFADLLALAAAASPEVRIESAPGPAWLAARDRLNGSGKEAARAYRAIIGAILLPCAFASVADRGRIVSLAFVALQGDLAILEAVVTDPACRQQGFARQCVAALLDWARGRDARGVALQVVADNAAALALYEGLGFRRDLYGYHYRTRPRIGI